MAAEEKIAKIGGEIVPGTDFMIDTHLLRDGWTEKNFEPLTQMAQDLEKRVHGTSN
jgi:hypothetical protein